MNTQILSVTEIVITLSVAIAVLLVFLLAFCLCIAHSLNGVIFSRQDKIKGYKYFTAEDFSLLSEELAVDYDGGKLYSRIYSAKPLMQCDKVIIFAHGFGAGSSSYMTEIAHFAMAGHAVVATDAYGCNNSCGESVKGFYAGAEAVIATYIAVKKNGQINNKKVVLVGHSWGAYSVLAASAKIGAEGVVAVSAFDKPATCVCDQIGNVSRTAKVMAVILKPSFYLLNLFKFGAKGNTRAASAARKSGAECLLIHGEDDRIVPKKHSAAAAAKGENLTVKILDGKRHNPYNTIAAEDKLRELTSHKSASAEEETAYLSAFDWKAATEEDGDVMSLIDGFIAKI